MFSVVGGAIALGLLTVSACKRADSPPAPNPAAVVSKPGFGAVTAGSANATEPGKVRGRWLRPDGGYILEIGAIAEDGRAEAKYFNPSPIHIAWARVKSEGGALKIDAELRDVNYPGCLYKLTYVPEKDQLVGTYFQAQMQQTHEIQFVRAP